MSYDHDLADRLREALAAEDGVTEQAMFGGLVFLVDGHISVAANGDGCLLVRMDPAAADELLGEQVRPMIMRGKPVAGYLRVLPAEFGTTARLDRWVRRSLEHVRALPAKKPTKKAARA